MTPEAWFTLAVIALMFVGLARELLSADVVVFSALVVLWLAGVVDQREALAGFSNAQVMTVAMLFIVSAAMRETGALAIFTRMVLRPDREGHKLLGRLLPLIATLSAFMNNTPLVAMFAPAVRDWALRNGRSPSKYLIPVSYAAILGGTITLIGTSTNLVVSGMLDEAGYGPLGMFELSPVGLPAAAVGVVFLMLTAPKFLPSRRTPDMSVGEASREYGVRLRVEAECPMIGRSVEEAGLRNLTGLYLAEIARKDEHIVPVRPSDRIQQGDILVLFGVAETVVELRRTQGLVPIDEEENRDIRPRGDRPLFEVVVSANSPLVGQTLRDAGFRRRYDAAVIAIHRNGERLNQKLGEVELHSGDVLMVEASPGFRATWGNSADFYLVAQLDQTARPKYRLAGFTLTVLTLMVVAIGVGVDTALAAATAAMVLMFGRAVRPASARKEIDLSVLTVIAASFGISIAIVNSGLAGVLAGGVVGLVGHDQPLAILAVLYITTAIITELLSNNAAAALMMPIAVTAAETVARANGIEPAPHAYAIVVAVAASLSFITPIGYQTNLMVYGPGGYRFTDFARLGVPLTILCFFVTMAAMVVVWNV